MEQVVENLAKTSTINRFVWVAQKKKKPKNFANIGIKIPKCKPVNFLFKKKSIISQLPYLAMEQW